MRGFGEIPVIHSTGGEVRVEDCDDGRRRVSQNGIIDDIQEVNQLQQTMKLIELEQMH